MKLENQKSVLQKKFALMLSDKEIKMCKEIVRLRRNKIASLKSELQRSFGSYILRKEYICS